MTTSSMSRMFECWRRNCQIASNEDETYLVSENESTCIPVGTRRRLENPGKVPLEIISVQSGTYLGENDIPRFDDNYGRK